MNNKLKKNYYYNLAYQIVAIVVPILITPYISRTIGVSGIGNYSYSKSLGTYFILLAEFSVEIYGQREIAFCNDDIKKRSTVFAELFIIRLLTTLLAVILYLCFIGFYGGLLKTLLWIQLIDLISVSIEINWLVRGVENFKSILFRNLTTKTLYVIGILLFVKNSKDLIPYVLICSCSLTIANLSVWSTARKCLARIDISNLNIRRHFLPLFQVFVPTIAMNLYHLIDKTMLGAILGDPVESGNYEQGLKLITIATTVITSFGTVMAPRVSSLFAEGDTESIRKNIIGAFNMVWLFALPMSCGLYLTAPMIVPWFFGSGFEGVVKILRFFSLIILPIGMKNVFGTQFLVATNRENKYTLAVAAGLVVNVVLNTALIGKWKAVGATVASVVSEVVIVMLLFAVVQKELKFKDVFGGIGKKVVATFFMGTIILWISSLCEPKMLDTIMVICIAVIIYVVTLLILKDKTTLSLIGRGAD